MCRSISSEWRSSSGLHYTINCIWKFESIGITPGLRFVRSHTLALAELALSRSAGLHDGRRSSRWAPGLSFFGERTRGIWKNVPTPRKLHG